jgi:putative ABC transport system permease protein
LLTGLGAGRILQQFYPDFPFQPPFWAVPVALSVSCAVGLLFGILPARNAARQNPVTALMRRKA